MIVLTLIVIIVGIIILINHNTKINNKKVRIIISVILIIPLIALLALVGNYHLYKIKYNNLENISKDEQLAAVAKIEYAELDFFSHYYETYYIYKYENGKYFYYRTSQAYMEVSNNEEKINKKGNINTKKDLEKIINNFEKKLIKSKKNNKSYGIELKLYYNGYIIDKQELLDKLFN